MPAGGFIAAATTAGEEPAAAAAADGARFTAGDGLVPVPADAYN